LRVGKLKQVYRQITKIFHAERFSTVTMVKRKRLSVRYVYTTRPFNPSKRKNYVNRTQSSVHTSDET